MPLLNAPDGAATVSVGDARYTVDNGRIEAAAEHVDALLSHGYTECVEDAKKILPAKKQEADQ